MTFLLLLGLLAAAEEPRVGVAFRCGEPLYCHTFREPEDYDALARDLESALAAKLGERFPFLAWHPGAGERTLVVELHRLDRSTRTDQVSEVSFFLSLEEATETGGRVLARLPAPWRFRSSDRYNSPLGPLEDFRGDLWLELEEHLGTEGDAVTSALLSEVPLTSDVLRLGDSGRWVLPFSAEERRIGLYSLLWIWGESGDEVSDWPWTAETRAFGHTKEDAEALEERFRGKLLAETVTLDPADDPAETVEGASVLQHVPVDNRTGPPNRPGTKPGSRPP